MAPGSGPLAGLRVVDVSALAPGPFCSMMLADFGADVIAVERPVSAVDDIEGWFRRGKRSMILDLRNPRGPAIVASLASHADVFIEGYRPGVMERLGLGPEDLLARNPRLIYTRLTGWGQSGPYVDQAGHDIDYIAVGGALGLIGEDAPIPPFNLLGDFAGGSFLAALGTVMALLSREASGEGQVVDAAMVDGAALLISGALGMLSAGQWRGRGTHFLSGNAPFYGVYRCADEQWFAVGAIEPRFYESFLSVMGLEAEGLSSQFDEGLWPGLRARVEGIFQTKSRDHWVKVFREADCCGAPMLELDELATDPHLSARRTVVQTGQRVEAGPAPRLSRTPGAARPWSHKGADTLEILGEHGFSDDEIEEILAMGAAQTAGPATA